MRRSKRRARCKARRASVRLLVDLIDAEVREGMKRSTVDALLLEFSDEENPFGDPREHDPNEPLVKDCLVCGRPVELEGLTKHCFEHGYGNDWPEEET